MKPRVLSKSRFKVGCECPTKLFFTGKKEYGDLKDEDSFLAALAEGGFQVGELAKLYVPGGTEIETLDYEDSLNQTRSLLAVDQECVVYEGAFKYDRLFVRVDIVKKIGNKLDLIEVKAKSIDPREEYTFWGKRGELSSEWAPYLLDVAFQTYVMRKAHSDWNVTPKLMLADKSSVATEDGLNQRFVIVEENGRKKSFAKDEARRLPLGQKVLVEIDVSREVDHILNKWDHDGKPFQDFVSELATGYATDSKIVTPLGKKCKECEFRIGEDLISSGFRSGFAECWLQVGKVSPKDLADRIPLFELWDYRKTDLKMEEGLLFLDQLDPAEISLFDVGSEGLSGKDRQALQIQKVIEKSSIPYIDIDGLRGAYKTFKYPLHFIDFETSRVAIPFNKGRRPYEQIAFQFSHHMMHADGTIEHKNEFINTRRGEFPNFDFLRALKAAVGGDQGTIFRYSNHENTVLREIQTQLLNSSEADRDELCSWIDEVTSHKKSGHAGSRTMVDLLDLVKKFYYHPQTQGSNSIKAVLPAMLADSKHLLSLYGMPTYGALGGIKSHNFENWAWLRVGHDGRPCDPYSLLGPIFNDASNEELDRYVERLTEGEIADGGAAMTAYARMQFSEMGDQERALVSKALLRYCELDTLAMVMIYQYWAQKIGVE